MNYREKRRYYEKRRYLAISISFFIYRNNSLYIISIHFAISPCHNHFSGYFNIFSNLLTWNRQNPQAHLSHFLKFFFQIVKIKYIIIIQELTRTSP